MNFINWHFSSGIRFYIDEWLFILEKVNHNFSPSILLKTLFAPWKQQVISKQRSLNPSIFFERITFNIYSRLIGSVVRLFVLSFGILSLFMHFIGGICALVIWVLIPVFSYYYYKKSIIGSDNKLRSLLNQIGSTNILKPSIIFSKEFGDFVASRMGIDINVLHDLPSFKVEHIHEKNYEGLVNLYLSKSSKVDEILSSLNLTSKDLHYVACWFDLTQKENVNNTEHYLKTPGIGADFLFGYTPLLNKYSDNISKKVENTTHLIGREDEVERISKNIKSNKSVILWGEPGVGRMSIVYSLASRFALGLFGKEMSYKRFLEIKLSQIFSSENTKNIEDAKSLFESLIKEASNSGNTVLVIKDIEILFSPSIQGFDFLSFIEIQLAKQKLSIIGLSDSLRFEKYIASNTRINRLFDQIEIKEPLKEEAFMIMLSLAAKLEKSKNVIIEIKALRKIIDISAKYITDIPFPEKCLDLLEYVVTSSKSQDHINEQVVNQAVQAKMGIPFSDMNSSSVSKLNDIENLLKKEIIGQDYAIETIARSLRSHVVGLKNDNKPIGSFLFLGPTGVGKTETAKTLAKIYYGSQDAILRFDMQQYVTEESVTKLIGSSIKNEPGILTTQIKNKPSSLLLLDEIEKAPSSVYNLLLTLLDEGYITDALGRKISCHNLFVIATSNAGSEFIRQSISKPIQKDELSKTVIDYVQERGLFTPEFLNRFDSVIVYEPLSQKSVKEVAKLILDRLVAKLKIKNIVLRVHDSVVERLSEDGFDQSKGARPMNHIVDLVIGDLLARSILNSEINHGDIVEIMGGSNKNEYFLKKKNK